MTDLPNLGTVKKPIIARLGSRYNISQSANQFEVSGVLVPVTNVDILLITPKSSEQTSNTTGTTHSFTVPAGKRWRVKHFCAFRANAEAMYVYTTLIGAGSTAYYSRAPSTATILQEATDLILNAGDIIAFNYTAGVSGILTSSIHYEEEDLY